MADEESLAAGEGNQGVAMSGAAGAGSGSKADGASRTGVQAAVAQPSNFTFANNYLQLNSGAHRKATTPFNAPAMVAHFSFWQDPEETLKAGIPGHEAPINWSERTEEYIRLLFCKLKTFRQFKSPNTEDGFYGETSKALFLLNRAIDIRGTENHKLIGAEGVVELLWPNDAERPAEALKSIRSNYFDLRYQTVVFEFGWQDTAVKLRFEKHQEHLTITVIIDLGTKLNQPCEITEPDQMPPADDVIGNFVYFAKQYNKGNQPGAAMVHRLHQRMYSEIWQRFMAEIMLADSPGGFAMPGRLQTPTGTADEIFVGPNKGLGYVIGDFRGLVLTGQDRNSFDLKNTLVRRPHQEEENTDPPAPLGAPLRESGAAEIVNKFLKFITCQPKTLERHPEITACRVLNRQAIYMSALGMQPSPSLSHPEGYASLPVYFLVYTRTSSPWQIGRFIQRMLHLGTVRILAIQRLGPLIKAGDSLRKIKDSDDPRKFHQAMQSMNAMENEFPREGLSYRIERSRYYVTQFLSGLPPLGIEPIEGFQPYDQFVLHRLEPTFDFINRLGVRLERLKRNLNTSAQTVSDTRLLKIQTGGEIALFFFLIPYYINANIGHIDDIVSHSTPLHSAPVQFFVKLFKRLIESWLMPAADGKPAPLTHDMLISAIQIFVWFACAVAYVIYAKLYIQVASDVLHRLVRFREGFRDFTFQRQHPGCPIPSDQEWQALGWPRGRAGGSGDELDVARRFTNTPG